MKETSTTIRRATLDDAGAIAEVHVASWRTTYPGIVDQSYIDALSVTDRAAAWTRRLTANDDTAPDIFVATSRQRAIVGFVSGGAIRDPFLDFDAELHAIYLLESAQRSGIGRCLMREWAKVALGRGRRAAVVRVLARNPACRFYERLGAELLRDSQLMIGGQPYSGRWYGWRDLLDLTA